MNICAYKVYITGTRPRRERAVLWLFPPRVRSIVKTGFAGLAGLHSVRCAATVALIAIAWSYL